ncbi:MAG: hypothetical protein ACRELA_06720 [Candidatus Rokuibacteriota bacterium]
MHGSISSSGSATAKDLTDVTQLVEANRLDVRAEPFRALCLKYATQEIYERIVQAFGE